MDADTNVSYYGKPIIKAPIWKNHIPWYFFFGGLAGASMLLTFAARRTNNTALARRALVSALIGVSVSPALLIADLGKPERFLNMLRVFKPTSPMNMGTWILSAFGAATTLAAAIEFTELGQPCEKIAALGQGRRDFARRRRRLRLSRWCENAAALLGLPMSTYTAVLISDTAVPVWHEARHELPLVFAGSAAASAGALAGFAMQPAAARLAHRLMIGGAIAELASSALMLQRLGPLLSEPYRRGRARAFATLATAFTSTGVALTALGGQRFRLLAASGDALVVAGAICLRFAVFHAGKQSALDPKYVVQSQRAGLEAGPGAGRIPRKAQPL